MSWSNSVLYLPFRPPSLLIDYSPRHKVVFQKDALNPAALRTTFALYYGWGLWKSATGQTHRLQSLLVEENEDFNVLSEDFEVSIWIRPEIDTDATLMPILTNCGRFEISLNSPTGDTLVYPIFRVVTGTTCISPYFVQSNWSDLVTSVESSVGIDIGYTWTHFRTSHSAGLIRFFINGQQLGPALPIPGPFNPNFFCEMMIGGYGSVFVPVEQRYPGGVFEGIMTDLEFLVGEATTTNFTPPAPLTGTIAGSVVGGQESELSIYHADTGIWFNRYPTAPSSPHQSRYITELDGTFKIVLPRSDAWDLLVEPKGVECPLWVPNLIPEDIDT